jgi:hypothetical protein
VHKRDVGESQQVADVLRGLLRTEGPHVRSFTTVHVTCICTYKTAQNQVLHRLSLVNLRKNNISHEAGLVK